MLAVLSRYKLILIIMALIVLAILIWLFIATQQTDETPSRGVFVLNQIIELGKQEGGI